MKILNHIITDHVKTSEKELRCSEKHFKKRVNQMGEDINQYADAGDEIFHR
ncbi:hypothetical protein [Gracilibacillus xinjiangensis]|uniref:Uncharacterized protein n=1 Tax=Gracilibacillus xinjiangensis TaxID=1193282 RepID=A0ABV8WW01_9BACI